MIIRYTPNDGEKREFLFRPTRLLSPEAEAIEDVGGNAWDSYEEFGRKFMKGNMRAHRAVLWVMLRREEPTVRFADLSFTPEEFAVDFEDDEAAALAQSFRDNPDMDDDQKRYLLATLGEELEAPSVAPLERSDSPSGRTDTD